ncbi:MAG: DNA mismatch repair protein MutS [Haloarculaceae archaeon]
MDGDADAALGPPEAMAGELTPMLTQYRDLCARYDDSLVLFQVGDFYEAFCEAAETVARLCEITLTKREDSTGTYPMAGVPVDNAESYIETLLDAGYRVAVADQVEDPEEATGPVERAVTRVVTPGTLTEAELLGGADNNFVAALARATRPQGASPNERTGGSAAREPRGEPDETTYGLAMLDVSTGDFYATGAPDLDAVRDEVGRFAPAEAVVSPEVGEGVAVFDADCMVTPYDPDAFDLDHARETVASYFGPRGTLLASTAEVRACGALLSYAEYARGGTDAQDGNADGNGDEDGGSGRLDYLNHLIRYDPREYMLLDAVAVGSLELFEPRSVHGAAGTALVDVVDETACAMGRRTLHDWLRRPLLDTDEMAARHGAVGELVRSVTVREGLHERLADVYDLERLVARVSRARANARDLRSLHDTLATLPDLRTYLAEAESDRLCELRGRLDPLEDVREAIDEAVAEDPPIELTEGGVLREGYHERLDELRETEREGKAWIDSLQESERERTGVDSLKVGHNRVHGYYIEVTDPNLDAVPEEYQRRQTLKNAERFVTPELKEREDEIVRAEGRADDLEYELFRELRSSVGDEAERIQQVARAVAELDALVSFAEVAASHGYCRPGMSGDAIEIRGGRHPVVERTEQSFVPNDTALGREAPLAVITGPNMSGKSTYMRQVALICVLAQAGSFVPAESARLPVIDRVFTRVGASDDIAGGRSTFMVEMTELADILAGATAESLVLLDEVGRGTSTADGFAIARAVTEHLHDEVGAFTLFATHHHDLTAVAEALPRARNRHFEGTRGEEGVAFDHEIRDGVAMASYGVDVARMAGVPDPVVDRARDLLRESVDERAAADGGDERTADAGADVEEAETGAAGARPELLDALEGIDVGSTTPLEALNTLAELKRLAEDG